MPEILSSTRSTEGRNPFTNVCFCDVTSKEWVLHKQMYKNFWIWAPTSQLHWRVHYQICKIKIFSLIEEGPWSCSLSPACFRGSDGTVCEGERETTRHSPRQRQGSTNCNLCSLCTLFHNVISTDFIKNIHSSD